MDSSNRFTLSLTYLALYKRLLYSVGTPPTLDAATNGRTRLSMAKIRVEVD